MAHADRRSRNANYVRRDPRWNELERLRSHAYAYDAVIEEQRGRRIRVGDQWLADFGSGNYLGFDLDEQISAAIGEQVRTWGTQAGWPRLLANPPLYQQIEQRLAGLLGAPDTLVLPTVSDIHLSAIPALAGQGTVFLDAQASRSVYDGCEHARGMGATLQRFRANDPHQLIELLRAAPVKASRLVCLDGVHAMTGAVPDLPAYLAICRDHGALLYVDDSHGFGVLGERSNGDPTPYGRRGNSVIRYFGESYEDVVLVGAFGYAYSSMLAFLALPTWLKQHLTLAAAPYLYASPSPTAVLATVLAGLQANEERGDEIRARLHSNAMRVLNHVRALGVSTANRIGTPIVAVPMSFDADLAVVSRLLWGGGIHATVAAYPMVPRRQIGIRLQVTAAHTDDEIDQLAAVLADLAGQGLLRAGR